MAGSRTIAGGDGDAVPTGDESGSVRADRSPWHWLLWVPLFVVLIPQIYNRTGPRFIGVPFFYWYQMATIAIGVACTLVVYLRTRR